MNIIELLEQQGIEVREHSTLENEYRMCCIFCTDMDTSPDYKFRFGFNPVSGLGHCFNCGWSSRNAVLAMAKKLGADDADYEELRRVRYTKKTSERPKIVTLPDGFQLLSEVEDDETSLGRAKHYIKSRGVTEAQLRRHGIGATVEWGDYAYRIVFPIRDPDGMLLGLVGRDWTGNNPRRYYNSTGTKSVFNANPKKYTNKWVIVSEGITKALAIERAFKNKICSVALLGNQITDVQAHAIREFKEVILFPDPWTDGGAKGFIGVAANLSTLHKVSLVWPWPKKQADDLTPEEIRKLVLGRRVYTERFALDLKFKEKE